MRKFFKGLWRVITFPFVLIFTVIAFPFKALHRRFPKFFPWLWKVVSFPFRLIFNVVAYPFRALYRRFKKFFDALWKALSFPYWGPKQFIEFLNYDPPDTPLSDTVVKVIESAEYRNAILEHIEAFRMHLLRSVAALALAILGSFFFTEKALHYLAGPVGGLDILKSIDMTESVGAFMRVAMFLGIAIAVPYVAFELWLFLAPGLKPRERKMGLWGIPLAALFFAGGAAFTFYVMLPAALPFLMNFLGMATEPRPDSYFGFVTGLMFWIGLFFEYPLVIYALSSIGIIKPEHLIQQWRLAVVIITIVAGAVTPTVDPINQALVMAPMLGLYFLSILFSKIAAAARRKSADETRQKAAEERE